MVFCGFKNISEGTRCQLFPQNIYADDRVESPTPLIKCFFKTHPSSLRNSQQTKVSIPKNYFNPNKLKNSMFLFQLSG